MKEGVNREFLSILGRVQDCCGMASQDKNNYRMLSWDDPGMPSQDAQDGSKTHKMGGGFLRVKTEKTEHIMSLELWSLVFFSSFFGSLIIRLYLCRYYRAYTDRIYSSCVSPELHDNHSKVTCELEPLLLLKGLGI